MIATAVSNLRIKSPLNYIGGKYKILNQILPLFPKNVHNFVDLFSGGCNVAVNFEAQKIFCNDNLIYLIEMYKAFQINSLEEIIAHIENRIGKFALSDTNEKGYKDLRAFYNQTKNPLDLFVLIAYSFNHQIRFNNNHEFNNPFGRERSSFNQTMRRNLERFVYRIKTLDIEFSAKNFTDFDFDFLGIKDFVYCDPPYLISNGTYNDGRRGFTGWSKKEELNLLEILNYLDKKKVNFALSNLLEHKRATNEILKNWLQENPHYFINYIKADYSNSNYQKNTKTKNRSSEVLITNYEPPAFPRPQTLFDIL